jgi:hypothetical protein
LYSRNTDQFGTNCHSTPPPAVQPVRLFLERAISFAENVENVCPHIRPRRTALRVEQQVRLCEIAYATRQNIEPPRFGLDSGIEKGGIKEKRINVPGVATTQCDPRRLSIRFHGALLRRAARECRRTAMSAKKFDRALGNMSKRRGSDRAKRSSPNY